MGLCFFFLWVVIYERFEVDFDLGVDGQLANQMGCWHFVIYIVVDVWHFSMCMRGLMFGPCSYLLWNEEIVIRRWNSSLSTWIEKTILLYTLRGSYLQDLNYPKEKNINVYFMMPIMAPPMNIQIIHISETLIRKS